MLFDASPYVGVSIYASGLDTGSPEEHFAVTDYPGTPSWDTIISTYWTGAYYSGREACDGVLLNGSQEYCWYKAVLASVDYCSCSGIERIEKMLQGFTQNVGVLKQWAVLSPVDSLPAFRAGVAPRAVLFAGAYHVSFQHGPPKNSDRLLLVI
jgi:hypothetical protein